MIQQQYQSIDPFILMAEVRNDLQSFRNVTATFLEIAPPALLRLLQAIQDGDCERITLESHYLRGTVTLVGAHDMTALLRSIETNSRHLAVEQIKSKRAELVSSFRLIEAEVQHSAMYFLPGSDRNYATPRRELNHRNKMPTQQ